MSSKISLAGDYKSLNAFIAAAEKKYPGIDVRKAIIESTAPGWNMVKQNFINGGFDRPLIGNFAEKLDTALQTIAQTARPAPASKVQAPLNPEDLPARAAQSAPTKFDQIRLQQEKRRAEQRAQINQMPVVEEPAPASRPVESSKPQQKRDAKSVVVLRLDEVPPPKTRLNREDLPAPAPRSVVPSSVQQSVLVQRAKAQTPEQPRIERRAPESLTEMLSVEQLRLQQSVLVQRQKEQTPEQSRPAPRPVVQPMPQPRVERPEPALKTIAQLDAELSRLVQQQERIKALQESKPEERARVEPPAAPKPVVPPAPKPVVLPVEQRAEQPTPVAQPAPKPPAPPVPGPVVQPAPQRRIVHSEPAPRPVVHTEPTPRPVVHQEPVFDRAEPPKKVDYCYYITMTALATAAVALSVLMATRDSE